MILDIIENARLYHGLFPALDTALEWLAATDLRALPDGRADIAEGVYISASDIRRKPEDECGWERHKNYADIQLSLLGEETIGVLPAADVSAWSVYDPARDCAVSAMPGLGIPVRITPGRFLVLFPGDAHKPAVGQGDGRKIVVKVLMP